MWRPVLFVLVVLLCVDSAEVGLVGAPTAITGKDDGLEKAIAFAKKELGKRCDSEDNIYKLGSTVNATKQVVAGIMYHVTVKMSVQSLKSLKAQTFVCSFSVWSTPWIKECEMKLTKQTCCEENSAEMKTLVDSPLMC